MLQLDGEVLVQIHDFKNMYVSMFMCMHSCSVTQLCLTLCDPRTVACQAPLTMGFPRQESWSWLPFPHPRDLPDPGIELTSLASPVLAGGFFTTVPFEFRCTCILFMYECICMFVWCVCINIHTFFFLDFSVRAGKQNHPGSHEHT